MSNNNNSNFPWRELIDFWTCFPLLLSKKELASSKINISGLFNKALTIAIICFYPPDNFPPLTPTLWLNFSFK
jgi:hypothetical protein